MMGDPRLRFPDTDAWHHAVLIVNRNAATSAWADAVGSAASAFAANASASPALSFETDTEILRSTARYVVQETVAWAPGRNGTDAVDELIPALVSHGLSDDAAAVVGDAWAEQGKQLVSAARLAAAASVATSGISTSSSGTFLLYTSAAATTAQGAAEVDDESEAADASLHGVTATFTLPSTAGGESARLVMDLDQTYGLFCAVDRMQREIDALFTVAPPSEHVDPV
jgi:hypothetical protein